MADLEQQQLQQSVDELTQGEKIEKTSGEEVLSPEALISNLKIENEEETNTEKICEAKTANTSTVSSGCTADLKQKRKLDKLIDGIFKKAQVPLSTQEDKYYFLAQKFIDSQENGKRLQLSLKEAEKNVANANKQRDLIQADFGKSLQARNKLESLCRELQRHNKTIKDENLQRLKDEEEKRKEISTKFQASIDDINTQVSANTEKNNALIQENVQLTNKLKSLLEQYEIREQHVEKVIKHKELENQLAEAKFQQSELKFAEINERSKKEKTIYESQIVELKKQCDFHEQAEAQLRNQLTVYTQKYEEFQSTLTKSNQLFESFKAEIDKMNKKIKVLEKESKEWKSKYENSNKHLIQSIEKNQELEKLAKKLQTKFDTMEQLSRTLQTERTELNKKIKQLQSGSVESQKEVTEVKQDEIKSEPQLTIESNIASEQNEQETSNTEQSVQSETC